MVVDVMVAVIVVMVVVAKVLMGTARVVVLVELLVIDVPAGVVIDKLIGMDIIAATGVVIAFEFALSTSCFEDMLCDMMVDSLIDALAAMVFASGIGVVAVLTDANINVSTSLLTALEFAVPKPG